MLHTTIDSLLDFRVQLTRVQVIDADIAIGLSV